MLCFFNFLILDIEKIKSL